MKSFQHATLLLSIAGLASLASCRGSITGEGETLRQDRALSGFSKVTCEISSDVEISQGATFALAVEAQGNLQPVIKTDVKGDELVISTEKDIHSDKPIRILITMPALDGAEVDGSGTMVVKDMFEPKHFDLELSGSGNFKGQFDAGEIESEINGSGDVMLSGRADRHKGQINGSGNIRAAGLDTKETKVVINGSGDAEIAASERMDVTINGSGDVTYHGNPEQQNTSINGSGRVNRR
jgi:hypothetical protein